MAGTIGLGQLLNLLLQVARFLFEIDDQFGVGNLRQRLVGATGGLDFLDRVQGCTPLAQFDMDLGQLFLDLAQPVVPGRVLRFRNVERLPLALVASRDPHSFGLALLDPSSNRIELSVQLVDDALGVLLRCREIGFDVGRCQLVGQELGHLWIGILDADLQHVGVKQHFELDSSRKGSRRVAQPSEAG